MLGQVSFEGPSSHPHFMAFEHYESLWKEVNVLDQSNPICFRMISANSNIYLIGAKVEMFVVRGAVFKFDIQQKILIVGLKNQFVFFMDWKYDYVSIGNDWVDRIQNRLWTICCWARHLYHWRKT